MNLRKIKNWIIRYPTMDRLWRFLRYKQPKVEMILRLINRYPEIHCKFLIKHSAAYGFGTIYPREFPQNIKAPHYFNEKLLWLKYYLYNESDLCAKCYDKYLVREYVKDCGCEYILNELYGVWDSVEDIPWETLPEEYVLKITNGCQEHIFKRRGTELDTAKAAKTLRNNGKIQRKGFYSSGDLFATKMPQRYICEKILVSEMGYESPEDYKFYCFNGEPKYLLFIMDRRNGSYRETFKRADFSDASDYFNTAENLPIEKPSCYEQMLDICRKLSSPFPFVRVDLYVQNGHPVFGELTFTPAGGFVMNHVFDRNGELNLTALEEMGDQLKLPKK